MKKLIFHLPGIDISVPFTKQCMFIITPHNETEVPMAALCAREYLMAQGTRDFYFLKFAMIIIILPHLY